MHLFQEKTKTARTKNNQTKKKKPENRPAALHKWIDLLTRKDESVAS